MTMKTSAGYSWMTASIVLLAAVSGTVATAQQRKASLEGGILDVQPSTRTYVLGELVNLEISLTNISGGTMSLPAGFDVWEGHVEVSIAFEDEPFRKYLGPEWGLRDASPRGPITLQPGETVRTDTTILYNHGIETKHLNRRLAAEIAARNIEDGYALARPGRYRIKAVLHGDGFTDRIESVPAEIVVDEPKGRDREVWAMLKGDPEYGYFIQAGGTKRHPDAARSRQIVADLEKVFIDFPRSRYAEPLGLALSKHRDVRERLEALGLIRPVR
jgi:hypothetical protein